MEVTSFDYLFNDASSSQGISLVNTKEDPTFDCLALSSVESSMVLIDR